MDITDFGIIYSAVVATSALAWNIAHAINQRRGRLRVRAGFSFKLAQDPMTNSVIDMPPVIDISVTNRGNSARHIERPRVRFNIKVDDHDTFQFIQITDQRSYPFELEPGKVFKCEFELPKFCEGFLKQSSPKCRFRIVIWDTMGRKYESSSLSFSDAQAHVQLFTKRLQERN